MIEGPFPEHYEPFETPIGTNPLHPKVVSNPAARVFKGDMESFGKADQFPYAATTYRLTEHFHYWTKNVESNAIVQPAQFVEIGEKLAKEKGIGNGDGQGDEQSRRDQGQGGRHQAHRRSDLQRQGGDHGGHPDPLGLHRGREDRLSGQHADAVRGRRQFADAGVQGVPGQHRESVGGNHAIYAITRYPEALGHHHGVAAGSRRGEPVAKLIDISKCIGCKACQVACMQWNDLRDDIGTTVGVYDNPIDLTDQSWTVMRFAECARRRQRWSG